MSPESGAGGTERGSAAGRWSRRALPEPGPGRPGAGTDGAEWSRSGSRSRAGLLRLRLPPDWAFPLPFPPLRERHWRRHLVSPAAPRSGNQTDRKTQPEKSGKLKGYPKKMVLVSFLFLFFFFPFRFSFCRFRCLFAFCGFCLFFNRLKLTLGNSGEDTDPFRLGRRVLGSCRAAKSRLSSGC